MASMEGKSARLGNVPSEAMSKGGLNETTPAEQRSAKARSPMSEGPKVERQGSRRTYKPAAYQLPDKEVEMKNGKMVTTSRKREDR